MKFSIRLEKAIQKLYEAFHNDLLIPECACRCAVGNVCDNKDNWKYFTHAHGAVDLTYVGKVNELFGKKFNGYSPSELLNLEAEFLKGCGYSVPLMHRSLIKARPRTKDDLFDGLSAAVSYLCTLEKVPDVMDYSRLFDYQKETLSEKVSIE